MSIESVTGAAGTIAPQFSGGDQKPPIKKELGTDTSQTSPSTVVTLGQVEEESPVYSPNFGGGDQKPPIKEN